MLHLIISLILFAREGCCCCLSRQILEQIERLQVMQLITQVVARVHSPHLVDHPFHVEVQAAAAAADNSPNCRSQFVDLAGKKEKKI
jgi:hypothetical protein